MKTSHDQSLKHHIPLLAVFFLNTFENAHFCQLNPSVYMYHTKHTLVNAFIDSSIQTEQDVVNS